MFGFSWAVTFIADGQALVCALSKFELIFVQRYHSNICRPIPKRPHRIIVQRHSDLKKCHDSASRFGFEIGSPEKKTFNFHLKIRTYVCQTVAQTSSRKKGVSGGGICLFAGKIASTFRYQVSQSSLIEPETISLTFDLMRQRIIFFLVHR